MEEGPATERVEEEPARKRMVLPEFRS